MSPEYIASLEQATHEDYNDIQTLVDQIAQDVQDVAGITRYDIWMTADLILRNQDQIRQNASPR